MASETVRDAWVNVSDELSALALKLKYHVEEERADTDTDVDSAFEKLADAIDDLAEAAGKAAKDPAIRDDLKTAGRLIAKAVTATVNEAAAEVRSAVRKETPEGGS